jgi:hypothetical protein
MSFLFKLFILKKRSILGGNFQTNCCLFIYYGHGSQVTLKAIKQVSWYFKLYVVISRRFFTCLSINESIQDKVFIYYFGDKFNKHLPNKLAPSKILIFSNQFINQLTLYILHHMYMHCIHILILQHVGVCGPWVCDQNA